VIVLVKSYIAVIRPPPSEPLMPVAPVPEAVHVPPKYPTALIFVDESAVKASAGRFFVVGAVKVRKPGQLLRSVQDIRDRHAYTEEFKFSKITRARIPVFCELIDVLEQSDAHIAACVVDKSRGANPFSGSDPQWVVHARVAARLLVGIINKRELSAVLLDQVSTPRGRAFDDTVRDMVNRRMRATSIVAATCVDSACNDGVQLADLVAGAVAHQYGQAASTARPTSHKGKIAARLAAAYEVPSLCDVRTDRVNVATLGVPGPKKRLRSVAESSSKAS
jgi:Protein of unknown function (DUF3800)